MIYLYPHYVGGQEVPRYFDLSMPEAVGHSGFYCATDEVVLIWIEWMIFIAPSAIWTPEEGGIKR